MDRLRPAPSRCAAWAQGAGRGPSPTHSGVFDGEGPSRGPPVCLARRAQNVGPGASRGEGAEGTGKTTPAAGRGVESVLFARLRSTPARMGGRLRQPKRERWPPGAYPARLQVRGRRVPREQHRPAPHPSAESASPEACAVAPHPF